VEHYFRDVCGHLLYAGGSFRRGSVGIRNWVSWLGGAVRIGGGGVALGRMVGFASCKPADALVSICVVFVKCAVALNSDYA